MYWALHGVYLAQRGIYLAHSMGCTWHSMGFTWHSMGLALACLPPSVERLSHCLCPHLQQSCLAGHHCGLCGHGSSPCHLDTLPPPVEGLPHDAGIRTMARCSKAQTWLCDADSSYTVHLSCASITSTRHVLDHVTAAHARLSAGCSCPRRAKCAS